MFFALWENTIAMHSSYNNDQTKLSDDMNEKTILSPYKEKRRVAKESPCSCCGKHPPFCWRCRCGFSICQNCMEKNFWGMSCNGITWQCPDCGDQNGYGNQ
jgi:hypothetical protein